MPIGENAIKRVENNGYSKVSTACPDMENSTVVSAAEPEKKAAKKSEPAAKKCACAQSDKNGFERFSFGQELPYWLL